MRKLKLQVQTSIDGFIAGPNGETDWMVWDWDKDLKQFVDELTNSIYCIVLGRKLAEGFIPHWTKVAANPDNPEHASGKKFTDTSKVVFTRTLDESPWENTELAKSDIVEEITNLKKRHAHLLGDCKQTGRDAGGIQIFRVRDCGSQVRQGNQTTGCSGRSAEWPAVEREKVVNLMASRVRLKIFPHLWNSTRIEYRGYCLHRRESRWGPFFVLSFIFFC